LADQRAIAALAVPALRENALRMCSGGAQEVRYMAVAVDRIADSCGYGVPLMKFTAERDVLTRWAERRSAEELADYQIEKNSVSIDGLPAIPSRS
jgi:hypothetical protein